MLAIEIKNKEFERKFSKFAKSQKKAIEDVALEAMLYFMDLSQQDKLIYTKKDPLKHLHTIKGEYDTEDLSDVQPYGYVEDSATYVHDLRRQRNS